MSGTSAFDHRDARIYVAGHRGLLGSALVRRLHRAGYQRLLLRTHDELNLCDPAATDVFFAREKPEYVFLAAARVGGILVNQTHAADFLYENLMIETSVLGAAHRHGVKRLIFFGSTCTYPRDCPQPMREEFILSGPVEPTSEAYATAKIAGMKLCQYFNAQYGTEFLAVVPATLYGPNDDFDPTTGHVLSALIRRFHDARIAQETGRGGPVTIWGSGTARREFLYVDDLADFSLLLARVPSVRLPDLFRPPHYALNVGTGEDISVHDLAMMVRDRAGYTGDVSFDTSKPDGAPHKLLENSRAHDLSWRHQVTLEEGIRRTYDWYQTTQSESAPQVTLV
jgi:GDP-L-fucose synthase